MNRAYALEEITLEEVKALFPNLNSAYCGEFGILHNAYFGLDANGTLIAIDVRYRRAWAYDGIEWHENMRYRSCGVFTC